MQNTDGTRRTEVSMPAHLVEELDQELSDRGLARHRSMAIAIALRQFLDQDGLDSLVVNGVQWPN